MMTEKMLFQAKAARVSLRADELLKQLVQPEERMKEEVMMKMVMMMMMMKMMIMMIMIITFS